MRDPGFVADMREVMNEFRHVDAVWEYDSEAIQRANQPFEEEDLALAESDSAVRLQYLIAEDVS